MGISRDSTHKRRLTGGKRKPIRKKRKFEMGRPAALTKLVPGSKRIHEVRCRGGNIKYRALRLDTGNFSWGTESVTKKSRLLNVVYNASNNELVRTNTLVKNCIIQIDATPFKQWYKQFYGVEIAAKKVDPKAEAGKEEEKKLSKKVAKKKALRAKEKEVEPALLEQFTTGRLLACVASRPGQVGRADGYILEGPELAFYNRQIYRRRK